MTAFQTIENFIQTVLCLEKINKYGVQIHNNIYINLLFIHIQINLYN